MVVPKKNFDEILVPGHLNNTNGKRRFPETPMDAQCEFFENKNTVNSARLSATG
jgi:hypothetical protein